MVKFEFLVYTSVMVRLVISLSLGFTVTILQSVQAAHNFSHHIHEPCAGVCGKANPLTRDDYPDAAEDYQAVTTLISGWVESNQSTFVSDLAHAAEPWIDDAVQSVPDAVVLLWIQRSMASDHEILARTHNRLDEGQVLVCDWDELVADPAKYMETLGNILGLSRPLGATHWTPTDAAEMKSRWHDPKSVARIEQTHGAEMRSTQFPSPVVEHIDESNMKWYQMLWEKRIGV